MPRGVYDRYPLEVIQFIKDNASADLTRREMREMVNEKFGCELSAETIKGFYFRNKLPFNPKYRHNRILTDEQAKCMITLIPGRMAAEVAEIMNEKYGLSLTPAQIRGWKKNHKVPGGYSTRFRPGVQAWNKGKKWQDFMTEEGMKNSRKYLFSAGNVPKNRKELGAVYERSDGYLWIKVQDGHLNKNWKQLHRYLWELENGPIPDGHMLIFLDGNRYNCNLDNLSLVTNGELAVINQKFGMTHDKEVNEAIVAASRLKLKISAAERKT